jgi:WD40 repeat protein/subtilisin-like proprotein convertase family protein
MPSVTQREAAEFFVVGGPVQPERPCYVERAADRRLYEALRAKRLCCVLGARAIGKSSLLLRAARALRASGTLVALVDLRVVAELDDNDSEDAWLRRIAERVEAELDLGVDVRSWWSARDAVGENRLVEFFWEVVLTNTTAPVVVLVDEVDAVLELPFAADFLDAIGGCYERRSRESDFARLGVVLAGCTAQRALVAETPASPFAEAEIIEPEDFSAQQAYWLAVAFGGEQELAQALMDRIYVWTGGHPYLTQRVARSVARKGGRLEDVERVVREQLLTHDAADKDPLLGHVRAFLGEPSRAARRATKLLHKLASGGEVAQPADVTVWERLWLSGTVRVDEQRKLRTRNRIIKELVASRWLQAKRGGWRFLAAAAMLLAALAAGGYWYTQRLPVADIATLTSATAAPDAVEDAYRRLRGLPGFTQRADELWLEALGRQSRAATTLSMATAADARLRAIPGQDAAADRLLSEFWLRRAREQAHAEQRDTAILLAQRAAALPEADSGAAAYLAELVGDDYATLERSLRLTGSPEYWHVLFAQATLLSIDAEQQVLRTPFGAAAGAATLAEPPLKLTALEHAALTRELAIEGEGTAGEFELSLAVQHAAAGELLVTLTAPSGAEAALTAPRTDGALVETFSFQAAQGSPLAQLADEGLSGVWRLTVVDRAAGNSGVFGGWRLSFGDNLGRDDLPEPIEIPDPQRVGAVNVQAVADRAVVWPVAPGAIGTVALWNLGTGQLAYDLTLSTAPLQVVLDVTGARVLAATDRALWLWNAGDGSLVARVATQTEFVLPPIFSADGAYVAIAERVDGASPLYSVLRSADASLVATFEGPPDAQGWELGSGGRYVALQGPDSIIRVLETRRGAERARLVHAEAVERLLHPPDGASLVTVDRTGAIAWWPLGVPVARALGRTADAASVSASADGRRLAYTRDDGAVAVLDVATGVELYRLRLPRALPPTGTQLSTDGAQLVTHSGSLLKSWSLPSKPEVAGNARLESAPTALALDRTSDLLAVGLASGQLQLAPVAASAPGSLAFFGHRGPVTAAALNGDRGIAATGGIDGIARVWDIASGAPTVAVMQPADAAISEIALSADGQYVASAAGRVVRVATVADGRVLLEVQAESPISAIAFAPNAAAIAVGDAAGTLSIAPLGGERRATVRLGAAAGALAFTPDGSRLAVGDSSGTITLVATASGESEGKVRHWSQPIRWLEQSPDGSTLLVATDSWLHALAAATPALVPLQSKLVTWPAATTVATAISATSVGFAGVATDSSLVSGVLDLAAAEPRPDAAALVARDWPAALALRLNDNGEPLPFDP